MLLDKKTAIVYGAAGAIGSAVARSYAREGADVHLVGRTRATLEEVAQRIRHDNGAAHVAQVDVLDRAAVAQHADAVAARGGIDICFNATSNEDVQGTPLLAMQFEEFLRPVTKAVTAHFNIAIAVGRHMTRRGRGVILGPAGTPPAQLRRGRQHRSLRRVRLGPHHHRERDQLHRWRGRGLNLAHRQCPPSARTLGHRVC